MAARKQPRPLSLSFSLSLLFLALSTLSCIINSSNASNDVIPTSVYWGQHSEDDEGTLREACDSRSFPYGTVIISYLLVSQAHPSITKPVLHLDGHCGSTTSTDSKSCSTLESQIKYCQDIGVKVFLSLRMAEMLSKPRAAAPPPPSPPPPPPPSASPPPPPPPAFPDFAAELAQYLLDNFLTGKDGPLGAVSLDGINIEDVPDARHLRWDALVGLLHHDKVLTSLSPRCSYDQNPYLDAAVQTGIVDYIWVEFYGSHPSCIYQDGNTDKLLTAWQIWTSNVTTSKIFLGLAADKDATGYIEPEVVNSQILPVVKKASNYGGLMIWDRYSDIQNIYSPEIGKNTVDKIRKCDCDGYEAALTRVKSLVARS